MCSKSSSSLQCLSTVQRNFFAAVPPKEFLKVLDLPLQEVSSDVFQNEVLRLTVKSNLYRKYQPPEKYVIKFLKELISMLELQGYEIEDDLYSLCSCLMGRRVPEQMLLYKTYILPDSVVTILESNSLVSDGTTGLCTWPASFVLTDWCRENCSLLKNKRILELGSGLGLVGISVVKSCMPHSYIFSDCHDAVLNQLKKNIVNNLTDPSERYLPNYSDENYTFYSVQNLSEGDAAESTDVLARYIWKNSDVTVMKLDWEIGCGSLVEDQDFNLILTSDLVYDSRIVPSLVELLSSVLNADSRKSAICACTERKQETLWEFLTLLNQKNIYIEELRLPTIQYFKSITPFPSKLFKLQTFQRD